MRVGSRREAPGESVSSTTRRMSRRGGGGGVGGPPRQSPREEVRDGDVGEDVLMRGTAVGVSGLTKPGDGGVRAWW